MTEKLVILEYGVQDLSIHIYNTDTDTNVDEDFISTLGYEPDRCTWAFGTEVYVVEHKERIK